MSIDFQRGSPISYFFLWLFFILIDISRRFKVSTALIPGIVIMMSVGVVAAECPWGLHSKHDGGCMSCPTNTVFSNAVRECLSCGDDFVFSPESTPDAIWPTSGWKSRDTWKYYWDIPRHANVDCVYEWQFDAKYATDLYPPVFDDVAGMDGNPSCISRKEFITPGWKRRDLYVVYSDIPGSQDKCVTRAEYERAFATDPYAPAYNDVASIDGDTACMTVNEFNTPECGDLSYGSVDSFTCALYEENVDDEEHGNWCLTNPLTDNNGVTPQIACCVCGGGFNRSMFSKSIAFHKTNAVYSDIPGSDDACVTKFEFESAFGSDPDAPTYDDVASIDGNTTCMTEMDFNRLQCEDDHTWTQKGSSYPGCRYYDYIGDYCRYNVDIFGTTAETSCCSCQGGRQVSASWWWRGFLTNITVLQREPPRRSCGEVQANATHIWCVDVQANATHIWCVTDSDDATDFSLATLLHDHHALAARMTPQKLEVIANDDSRVSVALARGPVCQPQMAWENVPYGIFVLTLPCRRLTWRGRSDINTSGIGLLRTRDTCEACPEGTYRNKENVTCQPRYAYAEKCSHMYMSTRTNSYLRLNTTDESKPVALFNGSMDDLHEVLGNTTINCSCAFGMVIRYVPVITTGELWVDQHEEDDCARPEKFLICVQTQRDSLLPFWEPVLSYRLNTGEKITKVRMCVATSRSGPDPEIMEVDSFYKNSVFNEATPQIPNRVLEVSPVRLVQNNGVDVPVYILHSMSPTHVGMFAHTCTAKSVSVLVSYEPPLPHVYAQNVFLYIKDSRLTASISIFRCQGECLNNIDCTWFSYSNDHGCALGILPQGSTGIPVFPSVQDCGRDVQCLKKNIYEPYRYKVIPEDDTAGVFVLKHTMPTETDAILGQMCVNAPPSGLVPKCPRGSIRDLNSHGLCQECGLDKQIIDDYRCSTNTPGGLEECQQCVQCPPDFPTRAANIPECTFCAINEFISEEKRCMECPIHHKSAPSKTSSCTPCDPGFERQIGQLKCTACSKRDLRGHYDATKLGCLYCPTSQGELNEGDICLCPPGWEPRLGESGCDACTPGKFKSSAGLGFCSFCPDGSVTSQYGSVGCTPCQRDRGPLHVNGTHCVSVTPSKITVQPTNCPLGYESVSGYGSCLPCGRGWYKNISGSAECLPCPLQLSVALYDAHECNMPCPNTSVVWTFPEDYAALTVLHPDIAPRAREGPPCSTPNAIAGTCQCSAGFERNQDDCIPCEAGKFKDSDGDARNCKDCRKGTYQPYTGKSQCVSCPVETYGAPGSDVLRLKEEMACLPCGDHAVMPYTGASVCHCTPGYFLSGYDCVSCPDDKQQPYTGLIYECSCRDNMVKNTSTGICVCAPGYEYDSRRENCHACPPGFHSPYTKGYCIPCEFGTYANVSSMEFCSECPLGTWPLDPTKDICDVCTPAGNIFNKSSGQCDITCGIHKFAEKSTSCENCPHFTHASSGSTKCTACGAHAARAHNTSRGQCVCENVGWRNVAWDNHPLGHPMTSCVPPDSHCPESAEHQRVVAWRLHAVEAHNATEGPVCPREAFDIDFMPSDNNLATQSARYEGWHAETGKMWVLAWSQNRKTYTIEKDSGVVAHFSVPGALRKYVHWEDTPSNRMDEGLFWICGGETVDVRPVVECVACSPGQYFARIMNISSIVPDSIQEESCSARAAYFEGLYEFHGEWHDSFSTVYRHNTRPLTFILNTNDGKKPILQIHGVEHSIDFSDSSARPTNGSYDLRGFSVNVGIGKTELDMAMVEYDKCTTSASWNFKITFDSRCLSCNTSNTREHKGWRFGDEASRELYWEQDSTHNDMPWYVANPTGSKSMALAYMHVTELSYATYAIVDRETACWSQSSLSVCALADLTAFYNMSHAGSRRVNVTHVYGNSNGLGKWEWLYSPVRDTPVKLTRCTEYECPRGMYSHTGYTPQYRLDCDLCPPGTYDPEDSPGCIDCPAGTYGTEVAQVDVTACRECPTGKYDSIDRLRCTNCPAGKYSTETAQVDNSSCTVCAEGFYDTCKTFIITGCIDHNGIVFHCDTEFHLDPNPDANGNPVWKANIGASYFDYTDLYYIFYSTTLLPEIGFNDPGWRVAHFRPSQSTGELASSKTPFSSICNTPCNKWTDIENISQWSVLQYYSSQWTPRNYRKDVTDIKFTCVDRNCTACPPRTFQAVNGTNRECTLCEAGKYSDSAASATCTDCPAGKYGTGGVCTACPGGKYQDETGETTCKECVVNCNGNIGVCGGDYPGDREIPLGEECIPGAMEGAICCGLGFRV